VATDIFGVSGRAMIEALIGGQRDPRRLAALACGRMRAKHAALVEALTGRFSDHHAYLARMLLDQHDALTTQIDQLTTRIEQAITAVPAAGRSRPRLRPRHRRAPPRRIRGRASRRCPRDRHPRRPDHHRRSRAGHEQFPTAAHLVSWAKLSPRTIQSGAKDRKGKTGKGNPYLKGVLGEIAAAAKTDTFLGEHYRRLVKRCGRQKALVAVARSILTIVWHLLSNPHTRYPDLGADYHTTRTDKGRRTRSLVHQLQALGHTVTRLASQTPSQPSPTRGQGPTGAPACPRSGWFPIRI